MHYEHIVAVNDPGNPLSDTLTRDQLWRGLVLRIRSPELFLPGVASVQLQEIHPELLVREMQLGNMQVRDRIHLQHLQQIRFETESGEHHPGGTLVVSIMEPEPDFLLVRFKYEKPASGDPDEEKFSAYLFKMWQQVDLDSVKLIRKLVEQDKL